MAQVSSDCGCYVQGTSCEIAAIIAVAVILGLLLGFAYFYWKEGQR